MRKLTWDQCWAVTIAFSFSILMMTPVCTALGGGLHAINKAPASTGVSLHYAQNHSHAK